MKFLTLNDPWASLMALDKKRIETRGWKTPYRGLVGIHASKGFSQEDRATALTEPFRSTLKAGGFEKLGDLPRGAVVAVGRLVQIVETTSVVSQISDLEEQFGNYGPNRWAWRFQALVRVPAPIPWKGALGLWESEELTRMTMNAIILGKLDE